MNKIIHKAYKRLKNCVVTNNPSLEKIDLDVKIYFASLKWRCFMKIVFSAVKIDLVAAVEIEILPWTIDFAVAVVGHRTKVAHYYLATTHQRVFPDFHRTLFLPPIISYHAKRAFSTRLRKLASRDMRTLRMSINSKNLAPKFHSGAISNFVTGAVFEHSGWPTTY